MAGEGKAGFGLGGVLPPPEVTEEQIRLLAGDQTALLQAIERHLDRLEKKFVEQGMELPNAINIPGSSTAFSQRLDLSTQPHNSFIICITAGTLNLWMGDYGGISQAAVPNWGTYTAGANVQYFVKLGGRVYTLVNPSTTVTLTGSLIAVAN